MRQSFVAKASPTGRAIQALVIFSTLLGVLFLAQAYVQVPSTVFDIVAAGWVLFVVDSLLTFFRPTVSYYLAFVLAILALGSSLPQSAHYAFIANGELLSSATFLVGSLAQVLLVVLVPYHFIKARRRSA